MVKPTYTTMSICVFAPVYPDTLGGLLGSDELAREYQKVRGSCGPWHEFRIANPEVSTSMIQLNARLLGVQPDDMALDAGAGTRTNLRLFHTFWCSRSHTPLRTWPRNGCPTSCDGFATTPSSLDARHMTFGHPVPSCAHLVGMNRAPRDGLPPRPFGPKRLRIAIPLNPPKPALHRPRLPIPFRQHTARQPVRTAGAISGLVIG